MPPVTPTMPPAEMAAHRRAGRPLDWIAPRAGVSTLVAKRIIAAEGVVSTPTRRGVSENRFWKRRQR